MMNLTLKSFFLTFLFSLLGNSNCNAQVGIGTVSPVGALDVTSTDEGLLIPRVALSATNVATVLTPTVSELVYNTFTSALGPNQVAPGFYYWNGTIWVPISSGSLTAWSLTGNTGTVATTNFIGTTDAVDFVTRTNNTEKMRVTSAGNVGIGTTTPTNLLEIGNASSGSSSAIAIKTATSVSSFTPATYANYNGGVIQSTYPGGVIGQNLNIAATGANSGNWPSNIAFHTRNSGGTNTSEKMRIIHNGNVGIGTATPAAKLDVAAGVSTVNSVVNATGSINDYLQFNVQNTSTGTQAQSGYSATADNGSATTGFAWLGINNSMFNFPTAYNIGVANDVSYVGSGQDMYIANANNTKSIIFSTGRATTPFFNERMRIRSDGSVGINNTGAASEKLKVVHAGAGNDAINAVNSDDNVGKGNAVWATNSNATGTSIIASAGATPPSVLPTLGAGIAGSHVDGYGVYANTGNGDPSNASHNGHAAGGFLLDNDNSVATSGSSAFAKLAGKDNVSPNGVLGVQNVLYGGYFQGGVSAQSYSYAGLKYNHNGAGGGGTDYKVIGNGVASTIILDENKKPRIMFCPEAPEVLFEDYGIAKLNNGEAFITLDKILASSMKIDDKHPLKVFIQLEGDCNGVFVTDKSNVGFRVKELNQGNSNVSFSWHIVGSRADSKDENGNINSEFENLRLPIGPTKLKQEIMLEKTSRKQ
jgi:hypothetical protein